MGRCLLAAVVVVALCCATAVALAPSDTAIAAGGPSGSASAGGLASRRSGASGSAAAALVSPPPGAASVAPPRLSVRAAALIDESTGQPLYLDQGTEQLPIASTTKLMTALVTLEHVKRLGTVYAQNDFSPAPDDSQIGLVPGERMSVHDLLLGLLLPSGDDAAEDLADNVGGGSVDRFVAMMNARAQALGLRHTHYCTPSGVDTCDEASAGDLVTLARYDLLHEPFIARSVKLSHATLLTGDHVRRVTNTNTLLGRIPWITGVKTGHTSHAGYVLVASGTRDGMSLIGAVLGTDSEASRNANALALLRWGFANFRLVTAIAAGTVLARPAVSEQPGATAVLIASHSVTALVARRAPMKIDVTAPKQLSGPRKADTQVGTATVYSGSQVLGAVALVLAHPIAAVSTLTLVGRALLRPVSLVVIALVLAVGTGLMARRRGRANARRMAERQAA